jgi:hypothetical protein
MLVCIVKFREAYLWYNFWFSKCFLNLGNNVKEFNLRNFFFMSFSYI